MTLIEQSDVFDEWKRMMIALQSHTNLEVQKISRNVFGKWQRAKALETQSVSEPPPPVTSEPDVHQEEEAASGPKTESVRMDEDDVTESEKEKGTKRVEGLHSPLPRAFRSKTPMVCSPSRSSPPPSAPKKRRRFAKRVQWAPAETLTTVRIFRHTDAPIVISHPELQRCDVPTPSPPLMQATTEWRAPPPMQWEATWKVRRGEESREKKWQQQREENIVAVDPSTLVGDTEPEAPYPADAHPHPQHAPQIIHLDTSKPTLTVPVLKRRLRVQKCEM